MTLRFSEIQSNCFEIAQSEKYQYSMINTSILFQWNFFRILVKKEQPSNQRTAKILHFRISERKPKENLFLFLDKLCRSARSSHLRIIKSESFPLFRHKLKRHQKKLAHTWRKFFFLKKFSTCNPENQNFTYRVQRVDKLQILMRILFKWQMLYSFKETQLIHEGWFELMFWILQTKSEYHENPKPNTKNPRNYHHQKSWKELPILSFFATTQATS